MTKTERQVIDNPDNQAPRQRRMFGVLTGVAWAAYMYLWLPLITVVVWYLGVKSAYIELYLRDHRIDSFLVLAIPLIVLTVSVLLLGWAEYNRMRFQRREDRRGATDNVSLDDMARGIGATPLMAQQLQQARNSVVSMSEQAVPVALSTPQFFPPMQLAT